MYIYSLPIFFTFMQLGTLQEYLVTVVFIWVLLFIATPYDSQFKEIKWGLISELSFYQYLFDSWNGHIKLWLVFWPFFICLNLILFFTDNLAKSGGFTVSSWDVMHFMLFTPIAYWTIVVWRNSLNTGSRYWAIAARFMTLSVYFEYAVKLVIRQDYPRIFFECQDIMLDYASCF